MSMIAPPLESLKAPALIIGTSRLRESSGGVHQHVYPATGRPTLDVPLAGATEIDRALQAARDALPAWSALPANERRDCLLRLALLLRRASERLAAVSTIENGMPRVA